MPKATGSGLEGSAKADFSAKNAVPTHPDIPTSPTLLLGASGILGAELARLLAPAGVVRTHFTRARPGSVFFDGRTMDVASLWAGQAARPGAAIVMLGVTAIDACARDPQGTARTNVEGVIHVLDQLLAHGVTPVFVSSDGVFDGTRGWWAEDDEPTPVLEYGRQKLAVERYLAATGAGLVVRLPKLMEDGPADTGFLPGMIQALGRTGEILCATDQFFTPASARDAAAAIALLTARGARGLYHVAGSQRLCRRELLAGIVEEYSRFAAPVARVRDCLLGDVPVLERRPLDTSMRSARIASEFGLQLRDAASVARAAVQAYFLKLTDHD